MDDDRVFEYDGFTSPNDKDRFDTKKDEDAFDLRDRMQDSVIMRHAQGHSLKIKSKDILYRELGTRRYTSKEGKLKLVEKKAGTGESPDHFESLLIARDAMKRVLALRSFRSVVAKLDRTITGAGPPSHGGDVTYDKLESIYA